MESKSLPISHILLINKAFPLTKIQLLKTLAL
jgi:hypothetical protein